MDARIKGAIKEGLIYYIGAMASLLAAVNVLPVSYTLMGIVLVAMGGFGAYLNYILGRIARAIILGCIALFFLPLIQSSSNQAALRPYYLIAGIVFSVLFILTIFKAVKRIRNK